MKQLKVLHYDKDCGLVRLTTREHRSIHSGICFDCGYNGAIKWNPYNKVVQCHNCGQTIVKPENHPELEREVVQFT